MMLGDLPVLIALPTVWSLMAKSAAFSRHGFLGLMPVVHAQFAKISYR